MPGSANLNIMLKTARKAGRSLSKDFREVETYRYLVKGPEILLAVRILLPKT